MTVSPEQIAEKAFPTRVMGYDRDEVEAFLTEVAAAHVEALEEIDQLRELLENPDELLGEEVREVLHRARAAAEAMRAEAGRALEEARGSAHREAAEILASAHEDARTVVEDAERRVELLRETEQKLQQRLEDAIRSTEGVLRGLDKPSEGKTPDDADAEPGSTEPLGLQTEPAGELEHQATA